MVGRGEVCRARAAGVARGQIGSVSAEYIAIVVLVGAVIGALWATGIPGRVSAAGQVAVCELFAGDSGTCPELSAAEGGALTAQGAGESRDTRDGADTGARAGGPPVALTDRFAAGSGAEPVWIEPAHGLPGGWDLTGDGLVDVADTTGDGRVDTVEHSGLGGLIGTGSDPDALVAAIRDGRLQDALGGDVPDGWWATASPDERAEALRRLAAPLTDLGGDVLRSLRSLVDPAHGPAFGGDLDALLAAGPIAQLPAEDQAEALRLALSSRAGVEDRLALLDGVPDHVVRRWLDDPALARRLGNTDGVPVAMRITANEQVLEDALAANAAQQKAIVEAMDQAVEDNLFVTETGRRVLNWFADTTGAVKDDVRGMTVPFVGEQVGDLKDMLLGKSDRTPLTEAGLLAKLERERQMLESFRGRELVMFDPRRGRVAEAFGDVVAADNLGIVVPGVWNDLENYSSVLGTDTGNLFTQAGGRGQDRTAMLSWLGYDNPAGALTPAAVSGQQARAGAEEFQSLHDALVAERDGRGRVSAVTHSYGTRTGAEIVRLGVPIDDLVMFGSPGGGAARAKDLGMDPAHLWAGLNDGDEVGPVARLADNLADGEVDWLLERDIGHGRNPAHERFGAQILDTGSSRGHAAYFRVDSQNAKNAVAIVEGRYDEVVLLDGG